MTTKRKVDTGIEVIVCDWLPLVEGAAVGLSVIEGVEEVVGVETA